MRGDDVSHGGAQAFRLRPGRADGDGPGEQQPAFVGQAKLPRRFPAGERAVFAGEFAETAQIAQHRPVFGAQKRIGVAQGADALQPARGAPAQSRHSGQRAFVGAEHAVNAAKLLVQRVGQGVDIAAGDGIIEQQFQKLMRPQIVYALQERAPAQALAVAGVGALRR